ncbi:MAG: hypothetical protein PHQ43_06570 [Dehalococcoidales bacterium]|nr:hypothetical protein [Dehalococcoidales bacterium]
MKVWKYHQGEWTEIDEPFTWNEGEDFTVFLQRSGYYHFPDLTFGDNTYHAELFTRLDDKPPYLVVFSLTSGTCDYVYIYDVPSLMQWLRDYAPVWLLSQMACQQEEQMTLLGRAFQARHGHSYENVCPDCDPAKWEKRQARRARAKQKDTKGGQV